MGRWALDVAFVWKVVLTLGLVLLYYCFSIGITFYNKWLTKSFHFPLFMTMLHLAVIFLFSALSRALVQCSSHRARVVLSWTDYLRRVAPTGLHLSTSEKIFRFQDTGLLLRVLGTLFLGGILAFGLGFSEFLLVSRTSSLTLSIAGIFKEVCTLLLAAHLLGDQISLLNWLGFALCLSGISLHVALKALHSRGDGPKPLKEPGSNPDLELLLRGSQPEEGDTDAEEYFLAQG